MSSEARELLERRQRLLSELLFFVPPNEKSRGYAQHLNLPL